MDQKCRSLLAGSSGLGSSQDTTREYMRAAIISGPTRGGSVYNLTSVSVSRIQHSQGHRTEAPSILCHVDLSTGQLTVSEQANEKCQRIWTFVIFHQMSENKDFSLWVEFFPWLFACLAISDWMSDTDMMCQLLSHVQLFVIPWTVACQDRGILGVSQTRILE